MITNINELKTPINWHNICLFEELSEDFIREFKDEVSWYNISQYQILSEDFIREFKDEVNWYNISMRQKLSQDFIREFQDEVHWNYVGIYQNLSESFIREFKDELHWPYISCFQNLSESFIREFKNRVSWNNIRRYQILSQDFIREFNVEIFDNNWNYVTDDFKKEQLEETGLYEIVDGYVYGYKSVKTNMRSVYNKNIQYKVGKELVDWHCDANCENENSFGLSLWNKEGALHYYSKGILLKVRAKIEDVKALVHEGHKLRCSKLEVLEAVI